MPARVNNNGKEASIDKGIGFKGGERQRRSQAGSEVSPVNLAGLPHKR